MDWFRLTCVVVPLVYFGWVIWRMAKAPTRVHIEETEDEAALSDLENRHW